MRNDLLRVLLAASLLQSAALAQRNNHVLPLQFGSPVVGEPVSATRTLDYEPAENSPDPVAVHAEERYYRDSAGRTRSEIKYPGQLPTVSIIDFVAHLTYRWTPGDTVVSTTKLKDSPAQTTSGTPGSLPADSPQIEGVPTRHNHHVTGTDNIEESTDSWFAPSLHLALLTIVDKPGLGKTTYRFVNITLGEPDAALFRVPADLKIQDDTPPPPVRPGAEALADAAPSIPTGPNAPAYASDPKFQKALASAKEGRLPVDERLARWKNASKIAKGQCVECLHQVLYWQMDQGQWKDAINSANQLDASATTPREKFYAESQRGAALTHSNNDEPKPEQLKDAEASLRSALAIAPQSPTVVYVEGRTLAMLGRDDEARQMFQKYVDIVKMSDPYRTRAEHFIDNPRLAAMRMAPAFTLISSEGEQLSLDDMGGKVVLLDFWATWCGPCRESLPEIQRIAKKFADQPFVVISISSDTDESAWKTFIQKNNMTWPQYRDAGGALSRAYSVSSIPHYFSIDTDGVLQSVKVGSGADVEGDVNRLLKKVRDAEKKKAKESEKPASGE
jgi:peroxiredoxin